MSLDTFLAGISGFFQLYTINIIVSLIIIIGIFAVRWYARPRIEESIESGQSRLKILQTANRSTNIILALIAIPLLLLAWGYNFHSLLLLSTGIITLTGVALFAHWSILSNITAFFILHVHPTFRLGNYIRIYDADNYIEGHIDDIKLFNTKLITMDNEIINYPNNLIISRPVIINPVTKISSVGKITDFANSNKNDNA